MTVAWFPHPVAGAAVSPSRYKNPCHPPAASCRARLVNSAPVRLTAIRRPSFSRTSRVTPAFLRILYAGTQGGKQTLPRRANTRCNISPWTMRRSVHPADYPRSPAASKSPVTLERKPSGLPDAARCSLRKVPGPGLAARRDCECSGRRTVPVERDHRRCRGIVRRNESECAGGRVFVNCGGRE